MAVVGTVVAVAVSAGVGFMSGGLIGALVLGGLTLATSFLLSNLVKPNATSFQMKPYSLSDFHFTQVKSGTPVPLVYGRVRAPLTVLWWGNLDVQELKEKVKTGKHSHKDITVGYDYWLDVVGIIGIAPKARIKGVWIDQKYEPAPNPLPAGVHSNIFRSQFVIISTDENKIPVLYINETTKAISINPIGTSYTPPLFAFIAFRHFYVGRNRNFFPNVELDILSPLPDSVPSELQVVDDSNVGVNAIGIVYDLLVNHLKVPAFLIDLDSWKQVAYKKKKYPVSLHITDASKAKEFIANLSEQIGIQFVYTDKGIGIVDTEEIPPTTDSISIDEILSLSVARKSDVLLPSAIKARCVDLTDTGIFETTVVEAENKALSYQAQTKRFTTIDLSTMTINPATVRLGEILKQISRPFKTLSLTVLPSPKFAIGNVLSLNYPEFGINSLFRVIDATYDFKADKSLEMRVKLQELIRYDTSFNPATASVESFSVQPSLDLSALSQLQVVARKYQNVLFLAIPQIVPFFNIYYELDGETEFLANFVANGIIASVENLDTQNHILELVQKTNGNYEIVATTDGSGFHTDNASLSYQFASFSEDGNIVLHDVFNDNYLLGNNSLPSKGTIGILGQMKALVLPASFVSASSVKIYVVPIIDGQEQWDKAIEKTVYEFFDIKARLLLETIETSNGRQTKIIPSLPSAQFGSGETEALSNAISNEQFSLQTANGDPLQTLVSSETIEGTTIEVITQTTKYSFNIPSYLSTGLTVLESS